LHQIGAVWTVNLVTKQQFAYNKSNRPSARGTLAEVHKCPWI
jgi:hypothetical protein